jgi:hypothetical protein
VYKTGRYSKYLPARLAERYHESEQDPDLLELRSGIALTDSRLEDLLKRVDSGESGQAWALAKAALSAFRKAGADGDEKAANQAFRELSDIIDKGMSDYAAWNEVQAVLEQRRRLVESERKRLVDMQQMISTDRAMLLIGAVTDIIRRNVSDRATLSQITVELAALLSRQEARAGDA